MSDKHTPTRLNVQPGARSNLVHIEDDDTREAVCSMPKRHTRVAEALVARFNSNAALLECREALAAMLEGDSPVADYMRGSCYCDEPPEGESGTILCVKHQLAPFVERARKALEAARRAEGG